ncbi:MAG TPA: AAA family ATPase [Gammaproteobacteria bacterium]|nr:AAA family ATPase [Gammaproteobacteria bacterium]
MSDLYADDEYLEYYQFEHDPFLARGSSFKFFAAKRRPVLVELHHLARYSKLMLVVTGPVGSGKTVLRQALVASSKEQIKNIVITATAKADAASMLQQVSAALDLPDSDIAGVLRHIEQMLVVGQEVHLIVDNAERLEESALLFLQRIAQGVNDACARVFVFSDSSICPLLEKVADNADLHHVIALQPWEQEEVTEYIEQRLVAAGQSLEVFSEQQLVDIYTQSQGWPGQVNSVAKSLLMAQINTKNTEVKSRVQIPYKHLAVLVVLGIALLLVWFAQAPETAPDKHALPAAVEEADQLPTEVTANQSNRLELDLSLQHTPEPVLRAPLAQAVNIDDEDTAVELSEQTIDLAQERTPNPVVSAPVPISTPPAEVIKETVVQPVALAEKKRVEPVRAAQPAAKAAGVTKPAPTVSAGSAGHSQWYKQQASARYTLQVLGTRSETTAQSFVQQNTAQYHYFRKEHQGQALFVVTYGNFSDRAAAQAAISNLPEKIRKDKPWPRTMLSIQQELR